MRLFTRFILVLSIGLAGWGPLEAAGELQCAGLDLYASLEYSWWIQPR